MPFAVPPALALALGAIGAFAAARWLVKESRRINAKLHPEEADFSAQAREPKPTKLRRDPVTGGYRPE
jgi:hypothetical protein